MEYPPGSSLAELYGNKEVSIGGFLRLRLCLEIACGIVFLHCLKSLKITHGVLKKNDNLELI